ncbi:unnamed protein product [Urochloa humidicola]
MRGKSGSGASVQHGKKIYIQDLQERIFKKIYNKKERKKHDKKIHIQDPALLALLAAARLLRVAGWPPRIRSLRRAPPRSAPRARRRPSLPAPRSSLAAAAPACPLPRLRSPLACPPARRPRSRSRSPRLARRRTYASRAHLQREERR